MGYYKNLIIKTDELEDNLKHLRLSAKKIKRKLSSLRSEIIKTQEELVKLKKVSEQQ
jgi:hypothetical protein